MKVAGRIIALVFLALLGSCVGGSGSAGGGGGNQDLIWDQGDWDNGNWS
jgi:hypothetical protein